MARGRRCAYVSLLLVAVLLAAACAGTGDGGDDERRVTKNQLKNLVLQPADLPPVFTLFDYGQLTLTDLQPGPRQDLARFERQGGWKARYRRSGSAMTPGPLLVVSMVDLFPDADAAQQDFEAYESELSEGGDFTQSEVGDEAVARVRHLGGVSYFDVAWRQANVTASLSVSGFRRRIGLADVVVLAGKQERRISNSLNRTA